MELPKRSDDKKNLVSRLKKSQYRLKYAQKNSTIV